MPAPGHREIENHVRQLLEPSVEAEGCDLVAVLLVVVGGRQILRLHLDRPGGVTVADCRRVSRLVSPLLDVEDPIPGSYDLEVSSPGMDRPLQRREDFQRFTGYRAQVRLVKRPGQQRYSGRLLGVEGDAVRLETPRGEVTLPLEEIDRAHLVLDLDEYRRIGSADLNEDQDGTGRAPAPRGHEQENDEDAL